MKRRATRGPAAGTSLVEAVVALAVMAFGMLAVVGIQSTLRLNADVAKQRSEAVRIGQDALEAARAFSVIEDLGDGRVAYDDIETTAAQSVTGVNTSYSLTRTVVSRAGPDRKEISIQVAWTDRNGEAQRIELNSIVGANDPRLALLLGSPPHGIPLRQPQGRNPGIPPQAKAIPGGELSAFKPPSPDGQVVWVFDNASGAIVGVCDTVITGQADLTGADISNCSNNATARFLQGAVRFATGSVQPGAADAEFPTSTALNLGIALTLTSTGHPTPDHVCFTAAPPTAALAALSYDVSYYCAVFVNNSGLWSGISQLVPLGFSDTGDVPWVLADDAADTHADRYRVCRYTPATSDAQPVPNALHPRSYSDVRTPLRNQNFLLIRAGDGVNAFTCPTDVPADPAAGNLVNSNTLVHQPAPT